MKDFWVCGRTQVSSFQSKHDITHVLSLLTRPKRPFLHPNRPVLHKLMWFEDVSDPKDPDGPTPDHVAEILRWGRSLPPDAVVLVHCEAGMCRSTAAALILEIQDKGVDKMEESFDKVLEKRPIAIPNPLIALYGGQHLGLGTKLVEMTETYNNKMIIQIYGHNNNPFSVREGQDWMTQYLTKKANRNEDAGN